MLAQVQAFPRLRLVGEVSRLDPAGWLLSLMTVVLTLGCVLAMYLGQAARPGLVSRLIFMAWARVVTFTTGEMLEFYLSFEMTLLPILMIVLG